MNCKRIVISLIVLLSGTIAFSQSLDTVSQKLRPTGRLNKNVVIDDLRRLEDEHFKSVVFEEYDEQYMYFVAAALVLLAVAFLIGDRRAKRRLFE